MVACGGAGTLDDGTEATTSSETSDAPVATSESPGSQSTIAELTAFGLQDVQIPEGVLIFEADNQSIGFGGVTYMVTLQADGIRLISIQPDGVRQTQARIEGASFGEVWNSGSELVLTGASAGGDLVLLTSSDGERFSETRIPVPSRYADEDDWAATSLVADVAGVAGLNGDLYLIARMGISWTWINDLAARSAYDVSDEVGDAARFASTIRRESVGDGDFLFTFENADNEVVYQVLASEAGIEDGYQAAYDARYDGSNNDFGFYGGWLVSATAVQEMEPPLGGGLDGDLRLNQLYSLGEGVAALVTDWSVGAGLSQPLVATGTGTFGSGFAGAIYSESEDRLHHSWDGNVWEEVADPVGFGTWPPPRVSYDEDIDIYVMYQRTSDGVQTQESDDGITWSPFAAPIELDDLSGDDIQYNFLLGDVFLIDEMADDPMLRAFKLSRDADGGGVSLDPVDIDTGPTIEWIDELPVQSVLQELHGYIGHEPMAPVAPVQVGTARSTEWVITIPMKYNQR